MTESEKQKFLKNEAWKIGTGLVIYVLGAEFLCTLSPLKVVLSFGLFWVVFASLLLLVLSLLVSGGFDQFLVIKYLKFYPKKKL